MPFQFVFNSFGEDVKRFRLHEMDLHRVFA
jgi:hypothetical protein